MVITKTTPLLKMMITKVRSEPNFVLPLISVFDGRAEREFISLYILRRCVAVWKLASTLLHAGTHCIAPNTRYSSMKKILLKRNKMILKKGDYLVL